jgi:hypothetical protein
MANPVTAQIVNRINNPFPAILSNLEQLNKQLNFAISAIEPGGDTFGTLTASRPNAKPFIVGFIPPDNPVNFIPIASTKTQIAKIDAISTKSGPNKSAKDLPDEFFFAVQQAAATANLRPEDLLALMMSEDGIKSGSVNKQGKDQHPVAKGLIQFTLASLNAAKMTREQWNNLEKTGPTYQMQFVANYFKAANNGRPIVSYAQLYMLNFAPKFGHSDPNTLSPDTILYPEGSPGAQQNTGLSTDPKNKTGAVVTIGSFLNATNKIPNSKSVKDVVARYKDVTAGIQPSPSIVGNDDGIARGLMIYSNSDMLDDPLQDAMGRNLTIASAERVALTNKQTNALQAQINAIVSTPPLILLINPSEFKRSYEQNTDDSPTTRYGHVVHTWLEKPLSISCSGVTAGQYIVDASGDGGLSNFYRVHSLSYQNLLSLLGIYKNNGVIFAGSESDPGVPILAMSLFIYYDNHIYVGSFDDFSINDAAEKPYNMEYDFKFNVRYDLELDGVNETLDFAIINQLQTGAPIAPTIPQVNVQISTTVPPTANFAAAGAPTAL